jgi:hypothetical protein
VRGAPGNRRPYRDRHSIDVPREAHRQLLAWLVANRQTVWTDTFKRVMNHVVAEQKRLAPPR